VLSTGNGVNGFTLDPSLGEFILTHPNIKIPKKGKIYSVNEGNAKNWDAPTAKYVEKCKFPQDGSSPKSLRYIGRYSFSTNAYQHFTVYFLLVMNCMSVVI
jgi:fructose-1,6-bisphosphatase I